ncbi:FUSC family protein [Streptomyces sp. NPDC002073]
MVNVPDGLVAAARPAVRVTVAAGAGFYLFLYGFGMPTGGTYALFSAVALAGLSRIPGTGRQRAAVVVRLLPVCWLLVVIGTFLSVRTWSAVLGMLVVGFVLAFVAVCGPRPAGAGPGLQLLYILPSFPPYDPGTLGERLAGTTTGLVLLVLAEAFLFPAPAPLPYRERTARALDTVRRCAGELARPPYTRHAGTRRAAEEASAGLRPLNVPEADRPAGPGLHDRALAHAGLATRALLRRLVMLPPAPAAVRDCAGAGLDVLRAVEQAAAEAAARLRGERAGTAGRAALAVARTELAARPAVSAEPAVLRRYAAITEVADAALAAAVAADISVRGRAAPVDAVPGRFWYARMRTPRLWWHRLAGHAVRRSVFFQNAVRISLALATARLIAGLDTLPHGFWAMLATLTLTRTTVAETGATVRRALAGTLAGALVAAALLTVVGTDSAVYAAVLPVLMLTAFTVGPVKGVGWAQAMLTLVVAVVFAQLAPSTWQLAEFRMLDVLIGSAIGAVCGLLAWPRGAHDELRRSAAVLMRCAAEIVVATAASVAAGGERRPLPTAPGHRSLQHALTLAESAFTQFQSEPKGFVPVELTAGAGRDGPLQPDWQATLMAGHHTLWGSDRLLVPTAPVRVPPLGWEAAAELVRLGDRVAGRMLLVSAALDPGGDTPAAPVRLRDPAFDGFGAEPGGAPRAYYAAVLWLDALLTDLERVSTTPPPPPGPAPLPPPTG